MYHGTNMVRNQKLCCLRVHLACPVPTFLWLFLCVLGVLCGWLFKSQPQRPQSCTEETLN